MVFIWKPRWGQSPAKRDRCRASVYTSVWSHQCQRKPKIQREVDGKLYLFCYQHDPVAIDAKRKARQEKWDKEWAEKEAGWARKEAEGKALDACKEAIQKIAAGHNDPRTLAMETLKMFGD
jgi:hypothetical protein